MYPVKGVTVEDNEISGYGNGVSISLADTDTVTGNQIKMKKTSAYSNLGIYAKDARGTVITGNTVSGTANAGIYINEARYAKGSGEKNLVSDNGVSAAGGDGIYLQSVNAASTAEKNTVLRLRQSAHRNPGQIRRKHQHSREYMRFKQRPRSKDRIYHRKYSGKK